MSSSTATRTTRFAPPAAPTRKRSSRRTVVGQGASVVGRADRPVLRIVADDEHAPVVTRVLPVPSVERPRRSSLSRPRSARSASTTSSPPSTTGTTSASRWRRPGVSTVRLTRRGRLVVLGLGLAATLGLAFYAASVSTANDHPEQTRVVTVQPGQTLWDISSRAAGGGDVRSMMSHLEAINHLDSASLQIGQHLRVPR